MTAIGAADYYDGKPWPVTVGTGPGGEAVFRAVVPRPAGEAEALQGAIREGWRREQEEWDRRPEQRHRHERAPDRFSALDRRAQNRSLGWPEYHALPWQPRRRDPMPEAPVGEIHMHPMAAEVYLLTLARQFEELGRRVNAMREELAARPEEYGAGRYFDLDLWEDCGPTREELGGLGAVVEGGLAHLICWAGTLGRGSQDFHRQHALDGFHLWSRRSLGAFSTWVRNPWFCDVRGEREEWD